MRPTWAEVSLGALRRNLRCIQERVRGVAVCAVVKADAYGHGALECARALEQEGAAWLGVTSTEEGVALRQAGIGGRVLLMTGFWRGEEDEIVRQRLTPAVWEPEHLEGLAHAAQARDASVPVHIKMETGMARLGVSTAGLPRLLEALRRTQRLTLEGLFTHLASAEVVDARDVEAQSARFDEATRLVREAGFEPRYLHLANSAAIAARPTLWRDMVRPGISLYGYYLPLVSASGRPAEACGLEVEPVLSWKTRVIGVREVGAGQAVGYNGAYVTPKLARIAALPVGYADGLSRQLGSVGRVIVRGRHAPMVGNISMDITLADVSEVPGVEVGDEVVLIGKSGEAAIDAWEHATLARTIPYEILCGISKRVPRRYVE